MEIAPNEGIPSFPPLPSVAPVIHAPGEGDGQNRPSASAGMAVTVASTPTPPRRILVQAGSAVSSIMNTVMASSVDASNGDVANKTPKKGDILKQKFPDISRVFSSNNTLLSGNDSDKWEAKVENIEGIIAVVNENERLAVSNLSDPVEEMTELDFMLENIDGEAIDGEEAIANDAAFKNVLVNMRTYKLAELKDLCKAINIPSTGYKTVLFQRIRDSSSESMTNPSSTKRKRGRKLIHPSRDG